MVAFSLPPQKLRRNTNIKRDIAFATSGQHIKTCFDFSKAISRPNPQIHRSPTDAQRLANSLTRITGSVLFTCSLDQEPLFYCLKDGLSIPFDYRDLKQIQQARDGFLTALTTLLAPNLPDKNGSISYTIHPHPPKDTRHRNFDSTSNRGRRCGILHFAVWADRLKKALCVSKDANGTTFTHRQKVIRFYKALSTTINAIGALYRAIDSNRFHEYKELYDRAAEMDGALEYTVAHSQVFLGMAILSNLQCEPHKDTGDIKDGWVAILCASEGGFEGGDMALPDLGYRVEFRPGDVIFMRSCILEHYITDFEGDRYSIVFFTHKDMEGMLEKMGL